jgi:hypothetical protein
LGRHFDDAIGKQLRASLAVGLQEIEYEVVPRLLGVDSEAYGGGAFG